MSWKLKYHRNQNIAKTERSTIKISPKPKYHQKWNVTKNEMSPKLKCHQNWNVTKTEMSSKWNVTKTEMSTKLKCQQNWNFTKTEMLPKVKCHTIKKFPKNSNLNLNENPGDRHWSPWSCYTLKISCPMCYPKVIKLS